MTTELPTVDIPGVEILAVGTWRGSRGGKPCEVTYTGDDLDGILASYQEITGDKALNYEPCLKLGHDDEQAIAQELVQKDGYPSIGWVSSLRRVGDKLVADLSHVPQKLGELIKARAYKKVSPELSENYEIGGKKYPNVLRALSLLGADAPAVKTISDIVAQYSAGDSPVIVFYEKPEAAPAVAPEKKEAIVENKLRALLALDEKADVLEAIKALKAKADTVTQLSEQEAKTESRLKETEDKVKALETSLAESNQKIALKERDERVSAAVREGKLTPAMRDKWGNDLALKDPVRFSEIIASLPKVIDLTERGVPGGNPEEVQLTETEIKVGEKMGLTREDLIKAKRK